MPVESIRKALTGYRVMAWATGIWLIALCYEMVLKYIVMVDNPPTWIAIVHGWVYFVYLIFAANLAVKVRWPIAKTIGVLLAGAVGCQVVLSQLQDAVPGCGRLRNLRQQKIDECPNAV